MRVLTLGMSLGALTWPAHAEVDGKKIKPPPFENGDSMMTAVGANWDLKPAAWLEFLQSTKTLHAVPFERGVNLPASDDIEAELKREGFVVQNMAGMQLASRDPLAEGEKPGAAIAARMARYLRQKVAVRVNDALYVTVIPREGLQPDDLAPRALAIIQGQPFDRIGMVGAFLFRVFPPPTGMLCARITFEPRAVNQDIFRLVDISIGAQLINLIHRPLPPHIDLER